MWKSDSLTCQRSLLRFFSLLQVPRKTRVKSFTWDSLLGYAYVSLTRSIKEHLRWAELWYFSWMPRISVGCQKTCFKNTYLCHHFLVFPMWEGCFYTSVSHLLWHPIYLVFSVILAKSCTTKQVHTITVLQPRLA